MGSPQLMAVGLQPFEGTVGEDSLWRSQFTEEFPGWATAAAALVELDALLQAGHATDPVPGLYSVYAIYISTWPSRSQVTKDTDKVGVNLPAPFPSPPA